MVHKTIIRYEDQHNHDSENLMGIALAQNDAWQTT